MKKERKTNKIIIISAGWKSADRSVRGAYKRIERGIYMSQRKKAQTGRKRSRKNTSIFRQHKKSILIIYTVLGMLAAVLAVNSVSLYARNEVYKQQEAELKAQIKEQKARSEKVEEYREYIKTDDYIKDVAEEKLGLVDPDEILFRPEE